MMLLGKLRCWWKGECARGKLVNVRQFDKTAGGIQHEERTYACPTCGKLHHRKVKRFPKAKS